MSLRVGIIGCGGIARFHASGYEAAEAEIVCCADADKDRAKSRAEQIGCQWVTDYKDLLADDSIEAVSVCLPNSLHFQAAVDALQAGKHVLCEKPMTTEPGDAARLVASVRQSGKQFQIAYMKRFHPTARLGQELVAELGRIDGIWLRVYHRCPSEHWAHPEQNEGWFRKKEIAGGAALVHSGSHYLDLLQWYCGPAAAVTARCQRAPGFDVDYSTSALVEMQSGACALVHAYWQPLSYVGLERDGWDEGIEIEGERGRLILRTPLWTNSMDYSPILRVYRESTGSWTDYNHPREDMFANEVTAFVQSVGDGRPCSPDVVDGYRVDKVIEAAYRSHETGQKEVIEWEYE